MEKIRLGSGKELELIVCGILADEEKVTLKFLPGEDSLDSLHALLTDRGETAEMKLLFVSGGTQGIYTGYTQLKSIGMELDAVVGYTQDDEQVPITGKLVTAVLAKPDRTDQRLTSLEETVDTLVMESLGVVE